MTDNYPAEPHKTDSVFDVISPALFWSLVRNLGKAFTHTASRTEKSAPETTKKQAKNKHHRKDNKAAINDMLHGRQNNQIWRKIINRNWKKQHADDKRKPSDFLQCHNLLPVINYVPSKLGINQIINLHSKLVKYCTVYFA